MADPCMQLLPGTGSSNANDDEARLPEPDQDKQSRNTNEVRIYVLASRIFPFLYTTSTCC